MLKEVWSDDVWVVDSTPAECGRSRGTVKRSDLAGWAEYGYCASHRRFFCGLRLRLVRTLQGLPLAFALTRAKANKRETLLDLLAATSAVVSNANCPSVESSCCGRPVKVNGNGLVQPCSSRCGRSSNRSTRDHLEPFSRREPGEMGVQALKTLRDDFPEVPPADGRDLLVGPEPPNIGGTAREQRRVLSSLVGREYEARVAEEP
jgi:hypothetical protein